MKLGFLAAVMGTSMIATSGCHDAAKSPVTGPAAVAPAEALIALVPAGTVQTAIQQLPVAADGSITFVVRVLANGVSVSSYQGSVTFAAGAYSLVYVAVPADLSNESHLYNAAGFSDGRIRFAGIAAPAFAGADTGDGLEALRFTVHAVLPPDRANLAASLELVGDPNGAAIGPDRVLASPGIHDTFGHLIR
jgi:hypothetical protein